MTSAKEAGADFGGIQKVPFLPTELCRGIPGPPLPAVSLVETTLSMNLKHKVSYSMLTLGRSPRSRMARASANSIRSS